jgi:hypothetical protein
MEQLGEWAYGQGRSIGTFSCSLCLPIGLKGLAVGFSLPSRSGVNLWR